jgi:hypothetical protein
MNAPPTSPFLDLLEQIASGIQIFEPYFRHGYDLEGFQDLVHRLKEMEHLGLVGRVWTQVRESGGKEYYNLAMVTNGLTNEGEQLLAAYRAPEK